MPTKSKTNRKTRNNRKTRKMKGGYWCIFENRENTDCSNNPIKGIEMSRYYYYLYKDSSGELTLFAYRPHAFKHLDDFSTNDGLSSSPIPIPFNTIATTFGNRKKIIFKKDPTTRPYNLQDFIDLLNEIFQHLDLSYSKLLKTRYFKPRNSKDNNTSIIENNINNINVIYEILWQKKYIPRITPQQIVEQLVNYNIGYNNVTTCIQIVSIRKLTKNNSYPINYVAKPLIELQAGETPMKWHQYERWFNYTNNYAIPKDSNNNNNNNNNNITEDKDESIPNNKQQLAINTRRSLDRLTISRRRRLQEQERLEQERLEQERLERETPNNSNLNHNATVFVPQTLNNLNLNYNAEEFVPGTMNIP